jgi:hypothetical protein
MNECENAGMHECNGNKNELNTELVSLVTL